MKALSFRQPWAELILQGRKTMDLRTYTRNYRGPLAVHAAKTVERQACLQHGLDPDALPTGGIVGVVELVDVVALDRDAYQRRRDEHLAGRQFRAPMFGWVLQQPQRLATPVPVPGRQSLFEVELEIDRLINGRGDPGVGQTDGAIRAGSPPQTAKITGGGAAAQEASEEISAEISGGISEEAPEQPFHLAVIPTNEGIAGSGYQLTLRQQIVQPPEGQLDLYVRKPKPMTDVVTLGGDVLRAVAADVMQALRQAGYRPTELGPDRKEPFHLAEPVGVRLGLLFLAVKPLSKLSRVEAIAHGIRRMPMEEVYYWYSKCTARDTADRAQKALRVLLAAE